MDTFTRTMQTPFSLNLLNGKSATKTRYVHTHHFIGSDQHSTNARAPHQYGKRFNWVTQNGWICLHHASALFTKPLDQQHGNQDMIWSHTFFLKDLNNISPKQELLIIPVNQSNSPSKITGFAWIQPTLFSPHLLRSDMGTETHPMQALNPKQSGKQCTKTRAPHHSSKGFKFTNKKGYIWLNHAPVYFLGTIWHSTQQLKHATLMQLIQYDLHNSWPRQESFSILTTIQIYQQKWLDLPRSGDQ